MWHIEIDVVAYVVAVVTIAAVVSGAALLWLEDVFGQKD